MRLFGEITKIEDQPDGTLKVYGVASTGARDDAGEIVLPEAMKAALPDYARYPALREMHQPTAAGRDAGGRRGRGRGDADRGAGGRPGGDRQGEVAHLRRLLDRRAGAGARSGRRHRDHQDPALARSAWSTGRPTRRR